MSREVLLGITGGIAAYKAPWLVRLMVSAQMNVSIIMTRAATRFVTPFTLSTLSGGRVWEDMWDAKNQPSVEHISLADKADLAVIAPSTANIIGKIAAGIADDMLTTVIMALRCPVLICPSMNVHMYRNPVFQANLQRLKDFGYHVMEPDSGYLACGWTGDGRLPEPEAILERIKKILVAPDYQGEKVLVTAGPTEEPIDPVRFITNKSSGKMGVAIAQRAAARGADVTLVAGPMKVAPPEGVTVISVRTAQEMYDRVTEVFPEMDIVIKAAAVADFRPIIQSDRKIRKDEFGESIKLVKNPDILQCLGENKRMDQVLVGFAAETQDVLRNAREKLIRKNMDMIVANDVSASGAGFDCDTNVVRFFYRSGEEEQLGIMTKEAVADRILDRVRIMRQRNGV